MGECDWEEMKTIHLSRQKMGGAGERRFVRDEREIVLRFYTKKE